jgi:uncharacterized protein
LVEVVHRFGEEGSRLLGIVAEPAELHGDRIGVTISGPGLLYHGFYFRTAIILSRLLAARGFFVLRYDPAGVGDSDGEYVQDQFSAYFNRVEKGMLVSSHIRATEFFKEQYKLDRIYCIGLCGGGITSLISAARTDLYSGVVSISAPVWIIDPSDSWEKRELDGHQVRGELKRYGFSLFRFASLWRFFTFRADYRLMWRVFRGLVWRKKDTLLIDARHSEKGMNRYFVDAFRQVTKKGLPVAVILAEFDTVTHEYEKRFAGPLADELKSLGNLYHVVTIKGANHKYSDSQSQDDLRREILAWIESVAERSR